MSSEQPTKTGLGIDKIGWKKIGKGAIIALAGAGIGSATGPEVIDIAIEQGWLNADMPLAQPKTYGALVAICGAFWSVLVQMSHKFLGSFPAPQDDSAAHR